MKVLVVGALPDKPRSAEPELFDKYCSQLGAEVFKGGHTAVICSVYPDSADLPFLQGLADAARKAGIQTRVSLHYPAEPEVERDVAAREKELGVGMDRHPHQTPPTADANSRPYAFLLCQLQALDESDVLLAVGGKRRGASAMLLHLASIRKKPVLPATVVRGTAYDFFHADRHYYLTHFAPGLLGDVDRVAELIKAAADAISAPKPGAISRTRFLISYSRHNSAYADVVENVLRRKKVEPYRDDHNIRAGEDWARSISDEMERAHVFIALWSQEYACSPHCFEEMEMALNRTPSPVIWICCLDDTRVTFPLARGLDRIDGRDRQVLARELDVALNRYSENLQDDE